MRNEVTNRRILLLIIGFGLLSTILTIRLFYLQIIQHQRLSQLALQQQERTIEVQPTRGRIYDRLGRPLALNRRATSFYAVPREIRDPRRTARSLAGILGVPENQLERRFRSRKAFVWIKRKVADEPAARVATLSLPGVHPLQETIRVYPEGRLAAHVLGFVGLDNQGLGGVELQYDRAIRGQSGWIRITRDALGQRLPATVRVHKESKPGQDLHLTIDAMVQHTAEKELEQGLKQCQARSGSVIVMNPRTGEILAMANRPDFDPNHFSRASAAARRNRAICDVFEPGSTFKIVTAAAALEEAVFQEEDLIDCENGQALFEGLMVRDHEPRGKLAFRDVIIYSSNIGAVKI
ncbi:penicillin-binding protein 2, partial [candidate division FCPU426 bacterium]|nr:penicillin-binding protein 2 [candidate division FCPU426 bacterium]